MLGKEGGMCRMTKHVCEHGKYALHTMFLKCNELKLK